jgi:hypothetical protein
MSADPSTLTEMLIGGGILPLIILCLVALEAAGLYVLRRWFGIGPGLGAMAGSLLSGAFLVLALYVALSGQSMVGNAEIILMCLAASFAVHLGDLGWRMRESGGQLPPHDKGLRTETSV